MIKIFAAFACLAVLSPCFAGQESYHSTIDPAKSEQPVKYPQIVLYSVSWCPHCREAKEYLSRKNIPFINKDVEMDDNAMNELTGKYESSSVPVIVIGTGAKEMVLKGFSQEPFQELLRTFQSQ